MAHTFDLQLNGFLAWVLERPSVTCAIIEVTSALQLQKTLKAADVSIDSQLA